MTARPPLLLDLPVVTAADVAALEDAVAALLDAPSALVLQGEAVLALEAAATGLAGPGIRALNIVTGPYGAMFGGWLRRAGADVVDLVVPFDRVVDPGAVEDALGARGADLLALVHAEAATGGTNDVAAVLGVGRRHGCLTVVDAVASVGAEPVPVRAWGVDVVVVGPQKGLAGPAGVCALHLSDRAWARLSANPGAPRDSVLSLLDQRERWLDAGRSVLVGTPGSLETAAFAQAVARVAAEGLPAVIARHTAAVAAARAGLRDLGLPLWIERDQDAAPVATTFTLPDAAAATRLLAAARSRGSRTVTTTPVGAGRVLRMVHAGRAATPEVIDAEIASLDAALRATGRV